jgi:selenocysteine-specific translation elongation factor
VANLTVAVLGSPGYAKNLGKKGTESDLTFANLKRGEDTVTFVEPARYPERLSSLFHAVSLADRALVVVDAITPAFGECAIMLQCAGITEGDLVLRNDVVVEQIQPLLRGCVLSRYPIREDHPIALRERLLSEAALVEIPPGSDAPGSLPVDHVFPVKGIGTVVLGCVAAGAIHRHESLRLLPSGKEVQVRSIQKHDDDADTAFPRDRVGVALKGVEASEIERGDVLTADPAIHMSREFRGRATLVPWWPTPLREGMVVHLGHWMQFLPARVVNVETGPDWRDAELTLSMERPLVHPPGRSAVLTQLEGGKLRVAGTLRLP